MQQQPGQPAAPAQMDPKQSKSFWIRHYKAICIILLVVAVFGGAVYKLTRPKLSGFIPDNVFRVTMTGKSGARSTSYMYFGDKESGYGAVGSTSQKKLEKAVAQPGFKANLKKQVAGGKRNTYTLKNNSTLILYDGNAVAFKIKSSKIDGNELTGTLSAGNGSVAVTLMKIVQ
ncbi:hypothetical protein [Lacticaseibacillus thailandensis]|uniref:Uncharacterized protein n=1 Tax=Lacticaseibacillus thailandensis DSM 22698 = JCM 13996 TaxID=1423810 RepID=A0A0R2C8E8_9LACO|nr:hypothetical protein [Lacticaseibacillus thailandensis]KRM87658.1 hypothetical protein FD19_GL001179 [Lacticaseibacillus thailandensis DSM 22698 = JCM 13996]